MNTLSIIILVVVIAIIAGLALLYVKKGGAKGAVDWLTPRFNLFIKMVTSFKFLATCAGIYYSFVTGDMGTVFLVGIGYLGVKVVIDSGIQLGQDFEYGWTGNSAVDNVLNKILSTRTWVAIGCMYLFYIVGDADHLKGMVMAYIGALGAPELAAVIKDWDFVKLKPKKTSPVEAQVPSVIPSDPLPSQPVIDVPAAVQRTPFDADIMRAKSRGYAERNFPDDVKDNEEWAILKAIDTPGMAADSEICDNVDAATDFLAWCKNLANSAFKEEMGFNFWDIEKHFNDLKVFKCPVQAGTDIEDLATYFNGAFKPFYAHLIITIRHIDQAFVQIARLGEGRVDSILQAGGWTYMNMMQELKTIKS